MKPQAAAYFLYGSADRGALNSEFFLSGRVAPRLWVRVGISHYVTSYAATEAAGPDGPASRYQRFETVPFAALRLRL